MQLVLASYFDVLDYFGNVTRQYQLTFDNFDTKIRRRAVEFANNTTAVSNGYAIINENTYVLMTIADHKTTGLYSRFRRYSQF